MPNPAKFLITSFYQKILAITIKMDVIR